MTIGGLRWWGPALQIVHVSGGYTDAMLSWSCSPMTFFSQSEICLIVRNINTHSHFKRFTEAAKIFGIMGSLLSNLSSEVFNASIVFVIVNWYIDVLVEFWGMRD